MNRWRIILHATFLGCATLASILLGFGVYSLLRPINQILVQVPVAALLVLAAYLGFVWLLARIGWSEMHLRGWQQAGLALAGAMIAFALIFYVTHYLTQGYLARFDNVLATWAFQLPVNGLAVWMGQRMVRTANREQAHG